MIILFIDSILALLNAESVRIPACDPVNEIALYPFLISARARSDIVTCSPVETNTSNSLPDASELV